MITRISSSRTNLLKVILIVAAIGLIYLAYCLVAFERYLTFMIMLWVVTFALMAGLFVFVSIKLTKVVASADKVIFSNIFTKQRLEVNLQDVPFYLIKNFRAVLIDPLWATRFAIISVKGESGKFIKFLVLSPSAFSKHKDIAGHLKKLQEGPQDVPFND